MSSLDTERALGRVEGTMAEVKESVIDLKTAVLSLREEQQITNENLRQGIIDNNNEIKAMKNKVIGFAVAISAIFTAFGHKVVNIVNGIFQ